MYQHDIIKRLIQQVAEAIARVVGLCASRSFEEADDELAAAERKLGLPKGLERLDDASVLLLLSGNPRADLLCQLWEKRAEVKEALGDHEAARLYQSKALVLRERLKAT